MIRIRDENVGRENGRDGQLTEARRWTKSSTYFVRFSHRGSPLRVDAAEEAWREKESVEIFSLHAADVSSTNLPGMTKREGD